MKCELLKNYIMVSTYLQPFFSNDNSKKNKTVNKNDKVS